MGRRGYVQKRHAEHEMSVCLSDWGQAAAARYLEELGFNIVTGSPMIDSENADRWEIELPWIGKGKRAHVDWRKMERIIRDLRKNPSLVLSEDTDYGDDLAALLEEGVKAAKKRDYNWIIIDFW